MNYIQYRIDTPAEQKDIILAFLSQLPFDSLQETSHGWYAYLPEAQWSEELERSLSGLQHRFGFRLQKETIGDRNWNALWESNFQPVQVDNFCAIRASFHPPSEKVTHEIIINPKMAFGTGHHETTRMMIRMMRRLHIRHAKVLDFGCGTGILAILASRLGATVVDAVDIDPDACENTLENIQINQVDNVQVFLGAIDVILDSAYHLILANINRNVILKTLPTLYHKLKKPGTLVVSGLLQTDAPRVRQPAEQLGFTLDDRLEMGEWACLKFLK